MVLKFLAKKGLGLLGKQKTTGKEVISRIKPNVPKTKSEKAKSKLAIAKQKAKGSKAKLDQTVFNITGS
jgi:hypothetical protein